MRTSRKIKRFIPASKVKYRSKPLRHQDDADSSIIEGYFFPNSGIKATSSTQTEDILAASLTHNRRHSTLFHHAQAVTIPTEPIGSIQGLSHSSRRSRLVGAWTRLWTRFLRRRSGIRLSVSKPPALLWLQTENRESITTSQPIASTAFRTSRPTGSSFRLLRIHANGPGLQLAHFAI